MGIAVPGELQDEFGRISLSRTRKRHVQRLFWAVSISLLVLLALAFNHIAGAKLSELNPSHVMVLVLATLLLLTTLGIIVLRDAYGLWQRTRRSLAGTRLQRRIFTMFCVVSILPTLIVTAFSVLFFNVGVNSWFDKQVSSTLASSLSVAKAYIDEHKTSIRNQSFGVADAMHDHFGLLTLNPTAYEQLLTMEVGRRNLSEAIVFSRERVLARTALSFSLMFERMPEIVLDRVDSQGISVISQDDDKIQGVVRISQVPNIYMLVTRTVDPHVIAHMKAANISAAYYSQLQAEMNSMQLQFLIAFCMLALLMLFASIWAGMRLSVRIIGPIAGLNQASERVRAGDYSIRVPEGPAHDEVGNLARTFNRMTTQIENQRRDLLEANRVVDERRRFNETVLAGVSAGVLALNHDQVITLSNRRARSLLSLEHIESLQGMHATDILPELGDLLGKVRAKPDRPASTDVAITQPSGNSITLHVRVTAERNQDMIEGFVVTFDDITALVQAQRSAAWSDVARRVAHEIKNPLTPIMLSTERLKKKFGEEITSDPEAYFRYIDTISRHVRDIGTIVEEFVNFARMPTAKLEPQALEPILRKVVFSEKTAHSDITYTLDTTDRTVKILCDEAMLSQALLNLLKNAAESLEVATNNGKKAEIDITLKIDGDDVVLRVHDNGAGFPVDKLSSLTEPYVTTRAKGTGLGLAIVKKTIEEHRGTMELMNDEHDGGAVIVMHFPKCDDASNAE